MPVWAIWEKERYVYRAGSRTLYSPVYGLVMVQPKIKGFM